MLSRSSCTTLNSLSRSFSSTCRAQSHIGREPIKYPAEVTFTRTPTALTITGPKGSTKLPLFPFIKLVHPTPNSLTVAVEDATIKQQRQMWGTTRTLIANAVTGMTEGFTVPLFLVGVGYRAALEKTAGENPVDQLVMKLGHSHTVYIKVPAHIKAEVPSPTKIVLSCTDKHLLGLFAAEIREWRKPEVYKGKGIFIGNEQIRLKSVKKK
ncbi:50s ribosomal protein [Ephemerocybe angulata]|uniref:50s ribosomal protein n=1 Tax=Ephemerocybe angulata TaxID=980116 RepID=A0A8H6M9Z0_9AGAR|nr:50s ribosomal protein [Tulosesus angulatus]